MTPCHSNRVGTHCVCLLPAESVENTLRGSNQKYLPNGKLLFLPFCCWVQVLKIITLIIITTIITITKDNNNDCIQRCSLRFFTIFDCIQVCRSSLCRKVPPTYTLKWPRRNRVQITCNTSSANHVQHVMCHLVRRDSSATKFDRVEIAFILVLLNWLKPLTYEGEELVSY